MIQSVYRKIRAQKTISKDNDEDTLDEAEDDEECLDIRPLDDEKVQKVCTEIMMSVHMNNVEIHKYLKRNKSSVDISDIKSASYRNTGPTAASLVTFESTDDDGEPPRRFQSRCVCARNVHRIYFIY